MANATFTERLGRMNRGVFFVIIVLAFVMLGIVFGLAAALILGIFTDGYHREEMLTIALFAPPCVGTFAGVVIATLASLFYRPVDSNHEDDFEKKPPIR